MPDQKEYVETNDEIEKSAEVIYSELVRQYDLEMDVQDTLKDKANGLMVLNGTTISLITLVLIQLVNSVVKHRIVLLFIIIPYIFFIYSLYAGIKSYETRKLSTVSAKRLHELYYRKSKATILEQLSSNIAAFIDDNSLISLYQARNVDRSISSFKYGMVSFVIILIIIGATHYDTICNLL